MYFTCKILKKLLENKLLIQVSWRIQNTKLDIILHLGKDETI